jgi:hypothetical protein
MNKKNKTARQERVMEKAKKKALALFLGVKVSDLDVPPYTDSTWGYGRKEWQVLTDSEADKAVYEYCKENAWAFGHDLVSSFVARNTKNVHSGELATALEAVHKTGLCETLNSLILALVGHSDELLMEFAEEAVKWDGRGHFLSPYNGAEEEISCTLWGKKHYFYAYRIN